jgi:hypothetical protein
VGFTFLAGIIIEAGDMWAPADKIRNRDIEFWSVYILSMSNGMFYTGYTHNLEERLFSYENGMVPYTASYRPV